MSQKPVSPQTGAPFVVETFHFQIVLLKLIARTNLLGKYESFKFNLHKGYQKFTDCKVLTPAKFDSTNSVLLDNVKLNFVVLDYNPSKINEFSLRIANVSSKVQKQIGEYLINTNNFINHFISSENGAFVQKVSLGEQFNLELQLYVERSRFAVERLIKDIKNPKPKTDDNVIAKKMQKANPTSKVLPFKTEQDDIQYNPHEKFHKFSPKHDRKEKSISKEDLLKKIEQKSQQATLLQRKKHEEEKRKNEFQKKQLTKPFEKRIESYDQINFQASKNQKELLSAEKKQKIKKEPLQQINKEKNIQKFEKGSTLEENKIPFKIKVLLPILILIICFAYAFFFSKSNQLPEVAAQKQTAQNRGKKPKQSLKIKEKKSIKQQGKKKKNK